MVEKRFDSPLAMSTGVLVTEQNCEFGLYPRLERLPDYLVTLPEAMGGVPVGVELHMVDANWPGETALHLKKTILTTLRTVQAKGGSIGIHAPGRIDYMSEKSSETDEALRGIVQLCEMLPGIAWVVFHADWFKEGDHEKFVQKQSKRINAQILMEPADGRPNERPYNTLEQIGGLVQAGIQLLIDLGHVVHAGEERIKEFPGVLDLYSEMIKVMHVSGVAGEKGFHYPLSSLQGRGVLQLLHDNQARMNGATMVIESPKPVGAKLVAFLQREIELLRNPELGLLVE